MKSIVRDPLVCALARSDIPRTATEIAEIIRSSDESAYAILNRRYKNHEKIVGIIYSQAKTLSHPDKHAETLERERITCSEIGGRGGRDTTLFWISDSSADSGDAYEDILKPEGNSSPEKLPTSGFHYNRDEKVRRYVLRRSGGFCEYCGIEGFTTPKGTKYLEPHHIIYLSKRGPDTPDNVVALCANHHREVHYGINGKQIESEVLEIIQKTK